MAVLKHLQDVSGRGRRLPRAKKARTYEVQDFGEKQRTFGIIALEGDLDFHWKLHIANDSWWEIEIVMRF